jgi:hypothetical protein
VPPGTIPANATDAQRRYLVESFVSQVCVAARGCVLRTAGLVCACAGLPGAGSRDLPRHMCAT